MPALVALYCHIREKVVLSVDFLRAVKHRRDGRDEGWVERKEEKDNDSGEAIQWLIRSTPCLEEKRKRKMK